jgi:hypothetical protein
MPTRDTFEEPPKPAPAAQHEEPEIASPETHEPPAGEPMAAPGVHTSPPTSMPPAEPQAISEDPPPGHTAPPPVVPPVLAPFPTKDA